MEAQTWHRGDWMQTFTGKSFYPLAPRVEDIAIEDVAHSLSLQCRYNGHTRVFYSVAEHAILVSRVVPAEDALWGLLHDAAEAYVGDMVRPLKLHMPDFKAAEDHILVVIAAKFGLLPYIPPSVHEADTRILLDEKQHLLGRPQDPWAIESTHEPLGVDIMGWDPRHAEGLFLTTFFELMEARAEVTA